MNRRAAPKLVRDVTDEQRSRRPIFIATLWAGAQLAVFPPPRRIDPYGSNMGASLPSVRLGPP